VSADFAALGGPTANAATDPAVDFAVSTDRLYWVTTTSTLHAVSASAPADAGAAAVWTSGLPHVTRAAVDSPFLSFTRDDAAAVLAVRKSDGTKVTIAATQAGRAGTAADGSGVYWTHTNDGTVMLAEPR
jgi:hypothetical protein